MAMPSLVPKYTIDDLERFPDDRNRYELVDGYLLVTPAAATPHQTLQSSLCAELTFQLGRSRPAHTFTPGVVEVSPGTHLEPDILLIPNSGRAPENWSAVTDWWLAVEISGRGSRVYDRDFKGPAYMRAGVPTYWRVDMLDRCVYVTTPDGNTEVRHDTELRWQPPLPTTEPIVINVPALFDGITGDD